MSPPAGATPLPMQIRYLIFPGETRMSRRKPQLKGLLRLMGLVGTHGTRSRYDWIQ